MSKFYDIIEGLQPIEESLVLKGDYKGTIWQRLVAGYYMIMPSHTLKHNPAWEELAKKFTRQREFLSHLFSMEPTTGDPYDSMKHLTRSINKQREETGKASVRVYSEPPSGAEDDDSVPQGHPVWSNDMNVIVRWVHDIMAHYYGQHKFSARGEYGAYNRHTKTIGVNTDATKALFTEVVAQTSCYYVYGDFVEQKVTLMTDHFDATKVGALNPTSPLNKYFELVNKELVKTKTFNTEEFIKEFPKLSKELKRQETLGKSLIPLQPIF